ncbi:MAG: recombinase family protein [Deltaproteobacteria bacterium]|nr:recombinase family protein [Deltaproteobacteria bacterium]
MGTKESTPPRAVELIRVSTAAQADRDTPELQRRALDRLRELRPCVVIERLEALGVSGALGADDRADLRRLAALSAARAFDELRVWNVDRLTRATDLRERAAIWGLALDAGATIVDATGKVLDPADESGIGEVDYYLQTFFASRERQKILARTAAGRRRAAEDGRLSQGQPPFGRRYDHDARRWVLVPEQAEIYGRIVREVLAGRSTREIAELLNRDGVPPTRGAAWGHSTIKRLLGTEAIVGRYKACGLTTEIPPIVDEVTWARARAALRAHVSCSGPTARREALLRGVLRCGACDHAANVISDGAGAIARYGCPQPSRRRDGACSDRRTIRVPVADEAVRDAILGVLTDPEVLHTAAEAGRARAAEGQEADELVAAERDVERLRGNEARLVRLLDEGLVTEDVARERLAQLRSARDSAETRRQRAALALADAPAAVEASEVEATAQRLGKAVRRASLARWQELLGILIPSREPYGLWLRRDGFELSACLPLFPSEMARDLATTPWRCGRPRRR